MLYVELEETEVLFGLFEFDAGLFCWFWWTSITEGRSCEVKCDILGMEEPWSFGIDLGGTWDIVWAGIDLVGNWGEVDEDEVVKLDGNDSFLLDWFGWKWIWGTELEPLIDGDIR